MRTPETPYWTARRFYLSLSKTLTRGRSSSSPAVASSKVLCVRQRTAASPDQTPPPPFDLISYPRSRVSNPGWELLPFPLSSLTTNNLLPAAGFIRSDSYVSFNSSLPFRFSYSTLNDRGRKDDREEVLREENSASSLPAISQGNRNDATDVQGGGGINDDNVPVLDVERQEDSESETGWSREEVVNWPNAVSLARLLSGPLLAWMILQGLSRPALVGLALAGASDWLDGYLARRLGINSVLGSYLDPLADKVLVGCIAVAMAYASLLHPALVALIVARDGVLLGGSFIYRAYTLRWQWSGWGEFFKIGAGGAERVEPLFISKVNMVLQLALIGTALVQPALEMQDMYSLIPLLSWSVVATTSLSWIAYAWVYLRRPNPAVLVGGVAPLPPRKASRAAKKGAP